MSKELKVGDKFKDHYFLYHIINIFEHNGELIVVTKHWRKNKQRWDVNASPMWEVQMHIRHTERRESKN